MNRALLLTLFFAACGPEPVAQVDPTVAEAEQPQVASTTAQLTGFPCDVRAALQANCAGCHTGHGYYFISFTTRDDFLQTIFGTTSLGAEASRRLTPGAEFPMPPTLMEKQPTTTERQLIDGWIQAGMPAGECGALTRP
jgi:hypothetical protein